MANLAPGIYETLLNEELSALLAQQPELRTVLTHIDPAEEPARYTAFLAQIIEKALALETDSEARRQLCNDIIQRLARIPTGDFLENRRLTHTQKPLLLEVTPPNYATPGVPRPETPLTKSTLFTGSPSDPQLVHELLKEMQSADSLDVLISFIKWSGLRLLMRGIEELTQRGGTLRLITTSYMGASEPEAIEWLARQANTSVKISYDTQRTRLHAKAYYFHRRTGFSTAYIGSANMSHAAMTSGLEWNLKITAQDQPHIVNKFNAEFATYWESHDFVPFDPDQPQQLRDAIRHACSQATGPTVFFDIRPHSFQERILDALESERLIHGQWRNLVVAATGTGKTVVAAFDFKRFYEKQKRQAKLLFVAHRQEILKQALATFRNILRLPDFGELLVGAHHPSRLDYLFCSVEMLSSRQLTKQLNAEFYDYIVVDEVHHGPAKSYRTLFDHFEPRILLGLTATPERMDGENVAADFGNRFAAEIRLPEALEEKLLCPFHYFAVADPVSLADDKFWKNGKYDVQALEDAYIGTSAPAQQRVQTVLDALVKYEPNLSRIRGIGFCVSVRHAEFMAAECHRHGIKSAVLIGETESTERAKHIEALRTGQLTLLFTRDVLNEGFDLPEINTVLFLRPTESLTIFLQQLGRGLRLADDKDCLTVLDFVGQVHRRYRIDRKLKALLPKKRFNILREVELDFPHLPAGCSIQLDSVARENVLTNIRQNLRNLAEQVPDRLEAFEHESGQRLTFGNFIRFHDYEPTALLSGKRTWTGWKAAARLTLPPADPDLKQLGKALITAAQTNGPREIALLQHIIHLLQSGKVSDAIAAAGPSALLAHYRLWGLPGPKLNITNLEESFQRLAQNPTILSDLKEILTWSDEESRITAASLNLPFPCALELHATYGSDEIKAALGGATFETAGITGVGLLDFPGLKAMASLVTFQKTEQEFSPTTMYQDYPVSRDLLHWESPAQTSQASERGQKLINHIARGYTMLMFARTNKKADGLTTPFTFLGPAICESYQSERPIQILWRLAHAMPAELFEENRRGG